MRNTTKALPVASVLLALVGAASSVSAAAPALNVLFYGNSFVNTINLPSIFSSVAVAGGQTAPSYVNAAVDGQTLQYHYTSNTAPISSNPQSGKWDYVILQEYSTRPIDATNAPNYGPSLFLQYAPLLYNTVKANSPNVKPVMYETWARQAGNSDLHTWYPSQPVVGTSNQYMAAANQMQSELHKYYYQQRTAFGNCDLAPVGDAFQALSFDSTLYQGDLYHESAKGGLMAAMLIYSQIYNAPVSTIPYATMNSNLSGGLAAYGISSSAAWTSFTATADAQTALVPEPTAMVLLGLGSFGILARRRRAAA